MSGAQLYCLAGSGPVLLRGPSPELLCHPGTGMRVEYKVDKVPFFKHSENFRLGQEVTMGRRDKKAGQQHATLRKLPGAVHVDIQLDGPDTGGLQPLEHACMLWPLIPARFGT